MTLGDKRHAIRNSLLLCVALSVVISAGWAISHGEWRTEFIKNSSSRTTDFQGQVRHEALGTVEQTHPLFGKYARANKTLGPFLATALIRLGLPIDASVSLVALLIRSFFGFGFGAIVFAVVRKRSIALLAVLLAYLVRDLAQIYGYDHRLTIGGIFTVSLFLTALAMLLLQRPKLSLFFWLLQGWAHPSTFICWAPLYWGVWLFAASTPSASLVKKEKAYLTLLLFGPLGVGLAAALAEAAGWVPFQGGTNYWALLRIRTYHSAFLFSGRYDMVLAYASQVGALWILSRSAGPLRSPLQRVNQLAAALGAGIGLLYLGLVETQGSVIAAMMLPLRLESLLLPLLLVNLFHALFAGETVRNSDRVLAVAYGLLLLVPSLNPLRWAWLWAWAGHATKHRRPRRSDLLLAGAFLLSHFAYLAFAPNGRPLGGWRLRQAAESFRVAAPWLILAWAVCRFVPRIQTRWAAVGLGVALIFLSQPAGWLDGWDRSQTELASLLQGRPEETPEKEAADWINRSIPSGTPVLSHPMLHLELTTHVRTSMNYVLVGYFIYAPQTADSVASELREIYELDVTELNKEHQRLGPRMETGWAAARDRALRANTGEYPYVIELAAEPASSIGSICYANDFIRVYAVAPSPRTAQEKRSPDG